MTELYSYAQVLLREGGYDTWTWQAESSSVVCFEDSRVVGFVCFFDTSQDLLSRWRGIENQILSRFSPLLRKAGDKAWNVYLVLLAMDTAPETHDVDHLEEDLRKTRKIARAGVQTTEDIREALLPVLPLMARAVIEPANYEERLNIKLFPLGDAPRRAFLGQANSQEVYRILLSENEN